MAEEKGNKDQRKSYTCSFKLKVVEYAELYSNSRAAEEYGVHRRRVQEWKNQKSRLVEQVRNFNGSTKRLKGGGRRKINPTKESDIDHEKILMDHLITLVRENDIELNKELVLREARIIDPNFSGGSKWANAFLDRLISHMENSNSQFACAELDDLEIDHYFEQVSEDEMRIVRHLEKQLLNFTKRAADRITLSELVYKEGKKQAHIFEVTPVWVSEFLDLHAKFIYENMHRLHRRSPILEVTGMKRSLSLSPDTRRDDERLYRQDRYENESEDTFKEQRLFRSEGGELYVSGDPIKRKRIYNAFHKKPFTIHQWFDQFTDDEIDF